MVLFKGKNGSGKSTLALESLLFALWGHTSLEALKDLPTRNVAKSCLVEVEVYHFGKTYRVVRAYPTDLHIYENGAELPFTTSTEAQSWLNRTFGDRTTFQKFRIVDAYTKDANFLEEGQTTLKKIIFSLSEDTFNNLRKKLTDIKREREIYNKDKAVVYHYFPSQKRLNVICNALTNLNSQQTAIKKDLYEFENELRNIERTLGQNQEQKKTAENQTFKLAENKVCYTCRQPLSSDKNNELKKELEARAKKANDEIVTASQEKEVLQDIIKTYKSKADAISPSMIALNDLKMKLQTRIQQKDYKYTEQDVLIAKRAIDEVDSISTYYLMESVKILEPIINDVLSKIGFAVKFTVNEKDKFAIVLEKEGIEYKYKDLSTGQKLLLQIAFKLAILMERGESGIIVADEGMGSLDEENLFHVLKIFENLPFQLFLVLHRFEEVPDNIKVIDLNKKEN
jgi:DNA repair exonuclease SbcCD ATPase subunit